MAKADIEIGLSIYEQNIVINRIIRDIDKILSEIKRRTVQDAFNTAQKICKKAIDDYYREYTPHLYTRKKSLYDAYDIGIRNGEDLVFELGPELMVGWHRVDTEYIYETMFKEGWHGGAHDGPKHPSPGKHYWRTPSPLNAKKIGIPAFSRWFDKDKPAPKSTSPYKTIKTKWDLYINGEYKRNQIKIFGEIIDRYIQEVL